MRSFSQGGSDVFVPLYQKISHFFFISSIFTFQPLIEKKVVKWYKIATFRWNCNVLGAVMAIVQDFRQIATFRWNCNVLGAVMAIVQKWYKNGTMAVLPRVQ
jgi:hypothetical protein